MSPSHKSVSARARACWPAGGDPRTRAQIARPRAQQRHGSGSP